MTIGWLTRLEQYTAKHPQEVLLVTAEMDGMLDHVAIFRGYSSSLTHPTEFDPDVPILPSNARICTIDRLQAPYNPQSPQYIQQDITWEEIEPLLTEVGV